MAKASNAFTMQAALKTSKLRIESVIAKQLRKAQKSGKFLLKHVDLNLGAIKYIISALNSKAYIGLTDFELQSNKIDTEGALLIASTLRSEPWPSLTKLSLANNRIGIEGIKVVLSALRSGACPLLETLSVWGNDIGDEGAKEVILLLKSHICSNLTNINIASSNVSYRLISKVKKQIALNSIEQKIEQASCSGVLDISEATEDREVIKSIVAAIKSGLLWNLSSLNLAGFHLSYKGLQQLFAAFEARKCMKLSYLNLENNDIGTQGMEAFLKILQTRALPLLTFANLKLAGNKVHPQTSIKIKSFIEEQQSQDLFSIDYVKSCDPEGNTPLHQAARNNEKSLSALLLAKGADVNARNYNGETPIILATTHGHKEVAEVLLKTNANADLADQEGNTPIIIAVSNNNPDLTSLIIEHKPVEGYVHFYVAATFGFKEIMKLLISKNINLNAIDDYDSVLNIAIDCAHSANHQDTVDYLSSFLINENRAIKPLGEQSSNVIDEYS